MTAALLSIGTELTRGELDNTNATWLAERLTSAGIEVAVIETVPDDRALLQESLRRLGAAHDVVIATGGLGPTTDDFTAECVAAVLGVPLERDEPSLAAIAEMMRRFGRELSPSNAKQADFPRGAEVLPNAHGTAPAFRVGLGRADAFFLPGVPREMKALFAEHIAPRLAAGDGPAQVRLRTFGLPESAVNDRLQGVEAALGVVLAYRANFPEIEVKVAARAATRALAERRAREAADVVRERLGAVVFAEGETGLAAAVLGRLGEHGLTLAVAESCTGGLVAELLTETPGASRVFAGGIIAYSNTVKERLLGVPSAVLAAEGAVSEAVAVALAEGARRALGADVGLGVTGIAGPGGGTPEKPVGLVHWAVALPDRTVHRTRVYRGTRDQVRRVAAFAALELVRRELG